MPLKPVQRRRPTPEPDEVFTEQELDDMAARARWTEPLPPIVGDDAVREAQQERLRQFLAYKAAEPILVRVSE